MTPSTEPPTGNGAVELHIEHLVLDGIEHLDGAGVDMAVRKELSRLLMQGGVPEMLSRQQKIAHLEGASINFTRNEDAAAVGARIAGSIYESFER